MYYGYLDNRERQGTAVIFTKPCNTKDEAEAEYLNQYRNLPRVLQIEYCGKNNGIMQMGEHINIPSGSYGVKIRI